MKIKKGEIYMRTNTSMRLARESVFKYIKDNQAEIDLFTERIQIGKNVFGEIEDSKCSSSIGTIRADLLGGMSSGADISGSLFGDVSKTIKEQVANEVLSTVGMRIDTAHIAPDDLNIYGERQKRDFSARLATYAELDIELLQYLEMYNEIGKNAKDVSEKSESIMKENEQLIELFHGGSDNKNGNSLLYGMAMVDFVRDGSAIDIDISKQSLVEKINFDIKESTFADNSKGVIEEIKLGLREYGQSADIVHSDLKTVFDAAASILDEKTAVADI